MNPCVFLGQVLFAGALAVSQVAFSQTPQVPTKGRGSNNVEVQRSQPERGSAGGAAQSSAQQMAPIDLTGYWVAVVTEDWRWRMMTPPKGDYASVPLNPAGKQEADTWTTAADGSCKAYGAAGIMRMPTRLHITWDAPNVLKIETDWGEQARIFHFGSSDTSIAAPSSLQGTSLANWEFPLPSYAGGIGFGNQRTDSSAGGYLKVVTTGLTPGWLRRNGVPYSNQTRLTEYYQTFTDGLGRLWFDVTTQVEDPQYLLRPFITSSDFRKEPDGSKWAPHSCKGDR